MPEFHFYGSNDDSEHVLRELLADHEIAVTPSRNYRDRNVAFFREVTDDLKKSLEINRGLYITGRFTVAPLCLSEVTGGEYVGTFVIDQIRGGPALKLTLPMCKKLDGVFWHLGSGCLFYPEYFWDDGDNCRIPPSQELKNSYKALRKTIKGQMIRKQFIGRNWLGRGAKRLLDDGKALILDDGKWLNGKGDFVKSNI